MICSRLLRPTLTEKLSVNHKGHIADLILSEIPLSRSTSMALERASLKTIGDVVALTEVEIREIPKMGNKSLTELKNILLELGLTFSPISLKNDKRGKIIEKTLSVLARKDIELKRILITEEQGA